MGTTLRKAMLAAPLALALLLGMTEMARAATPAQYGLTEGDVIRADGDVDVYIVNEHGYKRLFVNEAIFGLYGHLGFDKVRVVSAAVRDAFPTSGLFRNCEAADGRVFGLEVVSDDVANLRWVNTTGEQAGREDPEFFRKVFCINNAEQALYGTGPDLSSVLQVPSDYRGQLRQLSLVSPSTLAGHTPSSVYASWARSVAQLLCFEFDGTEAVADSWGGSGTLMRNRTGVIQLLTNRHVVPLDGFCLVEFWVEPNLSFTASQRTLVYSAHFSEHLSGASGDDEAVMLLEPVSRELVSRFRKQGVADADVAFPESLTEATNIAQRNVCGGDDAQVGDDVVIIGFPAIGSAVGPTLTRGNISGREGAYYVTDAKIEEGHSGGAAILVRKNCYLGIPTSVVAGELESLGRILDITRFQVFAKTEILKEGSLKTNIFDAIRKFF